MHMGMVAFIVKGSIPSQILTVDFHMFAEHRFFAAE